MYSSGPITSSLENALAHDFGQVVDARVHISATNPAHGHHHHQAASAVPPSRTTRKGTIQAAYELFSSDSLREPLEDVSASTLGIPPHLHLSSSAPSSPSATAPGRHPAAHQPPAPAKWGLVSTPGPAFVKAEGVPQRHAAGPTARQQQPVPTSKPSSSSWVPVHQPSRTQVADSLSEGQEGLRFRVSEDDMMMTGEIMGGVTDAGCDPLLMSDPLLAGAGLGSVLGLALPSIVDAAARTWRSTSNSSNQLLVDMPGDGPLLRLPSVAEWGLLDGGDSAMDGGAEHDPAYTTSAYATDLMMLRGASGMSHLYDQVMEENPLNPRGLSLCKAAGEGAFTAITAPGSRGWRCSSSGGPSSGFPFVTPDSPTAAGHPRNDRFLVADDEDALLPYQYSGAQRPRPGSRQAVGATVSSPHPAPHSSPEAPVAALSASMLRTSAGGAVSADTWYPGSGPQQPQYMSNTTTTRHHNSSSPVSLAPHPVRKVPPLLAQGNRHQQPAAAALPRGAGEQAALPGHQGLAAASLVPVSRHDPMRYGAAVNSVLGRALGRDMSLLLPFNISLPTGGEPLAAPDAAVTARGHAFDQALVGVLKDCLMQMGYTKRRATAAAMGDMSECTDIEMRVLQLLHAHMRALVSRYITSLTGPYAAPTSGDATTQRPGSGARRTTAESCASPADHTSSLAGGASFPPGMSAQQYGAMALGIDTSDRLVDRFRKQLKMYACHLWALMNILGPHPPREVKDGLAHYTGRSNKQITDWFTNWRARHWKKIISAIQASAAQEDGSMPASAAGVKLADGRSSAKARS